MYIDTINNSVQTNITAGASAAVSGNNAKATKNVVQAEKDSTAGVEATDGESTQVKAPEAQSMSYKSDDTRTSEEKQSADNEKIKKAIGKMNVQLPNSEVKFGIHEKTNRVTIKLIDKETKEVIKEFPPEKTLNMIAKCMELAGVMMDEKL